MKLLIITGEYPPIQTGDASHAFHIARQLAERGLEIHVLTSRIEGVVHHPGFTTHPIMPHWSWASLWRLRRFLRDCQPDAILLIFNGRMYGHHPMMTFAPTIAKRLLPSVRFVTQIEYPGRETKNAGFWTRVIRKQAARWSGRGVNFEHGTLLRDSDHVILLSGSFRDMLTEEFTVDEDPGLLDRKALLIPPPPLLAFHDGPAAAARARGRTSLRVGPEEFVFLYYGYVYPGKGIETLLLAFREVVQGRPEVRLVLVGGYGGDPFDPKASARNRVYWEKLHDLADSLGVADRVVWTGPCETDDEWGSVYLRAADVFVLPFVGGVRLNNSSFAAAAAHGLPVIATTTVASDRQIGDGENVCACPPGDAVAIAKAMEKMRADAEYRERLRRGAETLAEEWFSWERAMDRTLTALMGSSELESPPRGSARKVPAS